MGTYSNHQILSAVLAKWGQPLVESFTGAKMMQLPLIANIEAKIKSTGWVSPMWSISKELAPVFSGVANTIVEPLLANYLKGVPDELIPQVAHSFVENALKAGGLSLFEGKVEIESEDLEELRTLLRYNLPIKADNNYQVITEDPTPTE